MDFLLFSVALKASSSSMHATVPLPYERVHAAAAGTRRPPPPTGPPPPEVSIEFVQQLQDPKRAHRQLPNQRSFMRTPSSEPTHKSPSEPSFLGLGGQKGSYFLSFFIFNYS